MPTTQLSLALALSRADHARVTAKEAMVAQYLASRGLRLARVPPDGNCLFHAVVHQLPEPHITHLELRQMTAEFISTNRSRFEPFVTSNFEQFLSDLACPKEWAGDDALRGVAEVLRTSIRVITMNGVDCLRAQARVRDSGHIGDRALLQWHHPL